MQSDALFNIQNLAARYEKDFAGFGIPKNKVDALCVAWCESHRVYHDGLHLGDILQLIDNDTTTDADTKSSLRILAWYHDAVYDIGRSDNELLSANMFLADITPRSYHTETEHNEIWEAIKDTADHTKPASSALSAKFMTYDLHNLINGSLTDLIEDGRKLMREYGQYDWSLMKAGRIAVMEKYAPTIVAHNVHSKIHAYCDFLKGYTPSIALFPGTFFPFHNGHLDILLKAEAIFDKVILAPGINPDKPDNKERLEYVDEVLRAKLPNNQIEYFPGMLHDFVKEKPYPLTIVKGLRNTTDFESEKVQLRYMEDFYPDIKVTYIVCDRMLEHVSSSGIRSVNKMDKTPADKTKLTAQYIPWL